VVKAIFWGFDERVISVIRGLLTKRKQRGGKKSNHKNSISVLNKCEGRHRFFIDWKKLRREGRGKVYQKKKTGNHSK